MHVVCLPVCLYGWLLDCLLRCVCVWFLRVCFCALICVFAYLCGCVCVFGLLVDELLGLLVCLLVGVLLGWCVCLLV